MRIVRQSFTHRIEFHVGIGVDKDGKPITKPTQAVIRGRLLGAVAATYGGVSLTEQMGAWFDPEAQRVIREPGVTLVAYTHAGRIDGANAMAGELAAIAYQKAVIAAVIPLHAAEVWRA